MSTETVMEFYEALGFEETEIEDGLTAFSFEDTPDGSYALLTNDEGTMPESLKQTIIFAYYTEQGSFLWSVSFKNSYLLKDVWSQATTPEDKLEAVQKSRSSDII